MIDSKKTKNDSKHNLDIMAVNLVRYLENRFIDASDYDEFKIKYRIDTSETFKLAGQLFYYPIDDETFFAPLALDIAEMEKEYRKIMFKAVMDVCGLSKKHYVLVQLGKSLIVDGNPNSFLAEKAARYQVFCECTTSYFLALTHAIYWRNFPRLEYTGNTLFEVIRRNLAIVLRMEAEFVDELEEEFPTDRMFSTLMGK